jgi:hypothetical protein
MTRDGTIDGFLVWLTLDTGSGDRIDILEHEHCWLPVFLPAFDRRVDVCKGDRIEAFAGAVLCEDGIHPDYFVEGKLHRKDHEPLAFRHDSPHHAQSFKASPFYASFFQHDTVPLRLPKSQQAATQPFDESALRQRLRERLPEHLVPSAFVLLDRLPLSSIAPLLCLKVMSNRRSRRSGRTYCISAKSVCKPISSTVVGTHCCCLASSSVWKSNWVCKSPSLISSSTRQSSYWPITLVSSSVPRRTMSKQRQASARCSVKWPTRKGLTRTEM